MALTPDTPDPVAGLGVGSGDDTQTAADQPGQRPTSLVAAAPADVMAPIVVPNTLWASANPAAYASGLPAYAHLDRLAQDERALADTARWGRLEIIPTKADYIVELIRMNSLWPLLSGLACCAIEMMSAATSKNDMDRWGMFPFRASPRQADVLIVAGTLTTKMAGPLVRLWEQMPEPKWCVAMGSCAISGDFYRDIYSVIPGIDVALPVDVYIPGCPPNPETLMGGLLRLQEKVELRRAGKPVPKDERPETHDRTIVPAIGRYEERMKKHRGGLDPISQMQLESAIQLKVNHIPRPQGYEPDKEPA
jgi:NADH-quinone oxidoreductase subunit B